MEWATGQHLLKWLLTLEANTTCLSSATWLKNRTTTATQPSSPKPSPSKLSYPPQTSLDSQRHQQWASREARALGRGRTTSSSGSRSTMTSRLCLSQLLLIFRCMDSSSWTSQYASRLTLRTSPLTSNTLPNVKPRPTSTLSPSTSPNTSPPLPFKTSSLHTTPRRGKRRRLA